VLLKHQKKKARELIKITEGDKQRFGTRRGEASMTAPVRKNRQIPIVRIDQYSKTRKSKITGKKFHRADAVRAKASQRKGKSAGGKRCLGSEEGKKPFTGGS